MPSITGQSVLVIGGSSGIGFAAAKLALEQGAHVSIVSSNPTRVTDAVSRLQSSIPTAKITGHEFNLALPDLEARLLTLFTTITSSGTSLLDHIIYTAVSLPPPTPISEISPENILAPSQVSLIAPLLLAKLAPRFLNPSPSSSITFTGGHVSAKPIPNYTVMTTYATALLGMTRNLALDLAPIRVNLVQPGSTDTELWGDHREKAREFWKGKALLGKVGIPEEVGEAYVYLMRDWNATGSFVDSNGGSLLR